MTACSLTLETLPETVTCEAVDHHPEQDGFEYSLSAGLERGGDTTGSVLCPPSISRSCDYNTLNPSRIDTIGL